MSLLKDFPSGNTKDLPDLQKQFQQICNLRKGDIQQFANLPSVFMAGRKVGKVPTGSADIAASDRIGDFNYSASYLYLCVDNSGATWRRIALGTW